MKKSASKLLSALSLAHAGLASVLAILLLSATAPRLAAQSDNFNSAPPLNAYWQMYALPYYGTPTYSYPADDSGGKAFRIYAPPTGADTYGLGNARAGAFRGDVQYTGRFSVGADLLAWNATWKQEAGFLFYLHNPGLGTSDGYAATYSSGYRQLYISSVAGEVATTVAELGTGAITLDPTHGYRLVASSHDGFTFVFQLFDKSQPNNPWASAIGWDTTYTGIAGYSSLFVFEQDYPSTTEGADATFDNYIAAVPAAGAMPITVTDLSPPPAGKATDIYPTVTVGIMNRDTGVASDPTSIALCMDGVWLPNDSLGIDWSGVHKPINAGTRDFAGATVTYPVTNLFAWGSKHTNIIAFKDDANTWRTNTWTWTTAYHYYLFASNSLPIGSLSVRGFDTRMVQSYNGGTNLDNSLARALQQLAIPPQTPIDQQATSIVQVLDWNKVSDPPNNVPGLCAGNSNNIAVQSLAYLELTAGLHRFHINSDDRAGLYSGVNLADTNALALWENPGSTANTTFDFVVEADGLYPVRCIWEETGGGAVLHLYSVDLNDSTEVLINDPSDPTGVVKAWYPIACKSSSSVTGPYTLASMAVNALNTADIVGSGCGPTVVGSMVTGGTFTVPISGTARFYYLDGPRKTKITKISKGASNVVISYQLQ